MNVKIIAVCISLLALSSCGMRTTWQGVPDRDGHAYNTQAEVEATASSSTTAQRKGKKIIPEDVPQGEIMAGERMYSVLEGERLYQIAQRNGVTLHWIIKRNDLGRLPYTGSQLIIPSAGAH